MCATAAVAIHKLPPGPERPELHFQEHIAGRQHLPVSAEFHGESFESPGIDWSDYRRMQTVERKLAPARRLETPQWALRNDLLRSVLVRFVEYRAGLRRHQMGPERERLRRAMAIIAAQHPMRQRTLKALCDELVSLTKCGITPARRKRLTAEIENLDTVLRFDCNIAATILRLVHLYFRAGLDSVSVAQELGWKPPHVRQTVWRLRRVWARMEAERKARAVLASVLPSRIKKLR